MRNTMLCSPPQSGSPSGLLYRRACIGALGGALLIGGLCASTVAHAAGWGGAVGYSSLNLLRGLRLSGAHGAGLFDLHYRWDQGYTAGASLNGIDSADNGPAAQSLLYGSYTTHFSQQLHGLWTYTHYDALHAGYGRSLHYDELAFALEIDEHWLLSANVTPNLDTGPQRRAAYGVDAVSSWPLGGGWAAQFGLGYYKTEIPDSGYGYGNAGLSYTYGHLQGLLFYAQTDARARHQLGDDAYRGWVATLLIHF